MVNNLFMKKFFKFLCFVCISVLCLCGCEPKIKEVENNNHILNPTITNWQNIDNKWQINTFFNVDFNKVSWENIDNIKFFIYFGTRLVGTAESSGINLDNLLLEVEDNGIQVISCNFYNIKDKKQDDGFFVRSYCNIQYPQTPNFLKVTLTERTEDKLIRYTISNKRYNNES